MQVKIDARLSTGELSIIIDRFRAFFDAMQLDESACIQRERARLALETARVHLLNDEQDDAVEQINAAFEISVAARLATAEQLTTVLRHCLN